MKIDVLTQIALGEVDYSQAIDENFITSIDGVRQILVGLSNGMLNIFDEDLSFTP